MDDSGRPLGTSTLLVLASAEMKAGAWLVGWGRGRGAGSPGPGELEEGPPGWLDTSDTSLLKVLVRNFTRPVFGLVFLSTFSNWNCFPQSSWFKKGDAVDTTGRCISVG